MPLPSFLQALAARYDASVMRPPAPTSSVAASPEWQRLALWCFTGAGEGGAPLLRPWALPRVEQRFAAAVLAGEHGEERRQLVQGFLRHLDGSTGLEALPTRAAQLALRLQVKVRDAMWWRARQRDDPWDCGYLLAGAAAEVSLGRFLPRRATLLVAEDLPAAGLRRCIEVLGARSPLFAHPVRLLVPGGVPAQEHGLPPVP